jgi:type IV pilus assembly protein PilZ
VQEQRRHFRKPIELAVEFNVADGPRKPGTCRDFSLGGMHIDAEETAPFGANVTIHMTVGNARAPSALPGIVRWVKPGSMGVQFGLLGARETYAITELLAKG